MKEELIKRLQAKYGANFKMPLSKDLGVNVSTVRRMFNQRERINPVWIRAINDVLRED